jgi:hypothetical protein
LKYTFIKGKDNILKPLLFISRSHCLFHSSTDNAYLTIDQEAEPIDTQLTVREKFQQAAIYGRSVVSNPQLKAEYKAVAKPGQSAYNVAVADFFALPILRK